jgi:hypothetical protein
MCRTSQYNVAITVLLVLQMFISGEGQVHILVASATAHAGYQNIILLIYLIWH